MTDLLPAWPMLSAFLVASLVLAVTPGPAVLYIITRSTTQGRRVGLASAMGIAVGNLANMVAASLGLAALFAISAVTFTAVKYAGALYLLYLGVRALYGPRREGPAVAPQTAFLTRAFRDGMMVALFNPKTTLFFAAFLPQFLSKWAEPMAQSVVLGTLFVALAAVTDSAYAVASGSLAPVLTRARGVRFVARYATASALIGLGVFAAVTGSRDGR
jgi:threonine/homoserine/homoserine lactone efflux protein